MITGPRILLAALAALYLAFLAWYGGRGAPMTPEETDRIFATIAERAKHEPKNESIPDGKLREELRRLAASDDGNEFFMLNLIRYRPKAVYPAGFSYDDDARAADRRYSKAIIPYLLRHGGLPAYIGEPEGRFLDEAGDPEWHRVVLVRYRSRRDMLEMVADLAGQNVAVHKWASIEKTQVFPTRAEFSFISVRMFVGVQLALLGLLLHAILKRVVPGYRPKAPA
jgi:hypothetical protein